MFKKIILLLTVVMLLLSLIGCGNQQKTSESKVLYKVTDAKGRALEFKEKPQRIVCTYIWGDEILLDLVDHKRIAGLDKWVHDPQLSSATKQAEDVKTIVENNPESLLKVKPDLILMPSHRVNDNHVKSLEEMGCKVYIYQDCENLAGIEAMITSIAAGVGEPEQGQKLVNKLRADLDKVKHLNNNKMAQPTALMFMRFGAYGGEGTIHHDVMTAAGFRDAYNFVRKETAKGMGTKGILSKEEVIKANPEVFLMAQWTVGGTFNSSSKQFEEMCNDPAYAAVKAVQNKAVYIFPQRLVNDMSHHTGENIIELAKATGRLKE